MNLPPPRIPRRHLLLATALATLDGSATVQASRRSHYGGQLELRLPLNPTFLDPHDPSNLTATLLGRAVFEPLYALTPSGTVYPTLAASLPIQREAGYEVRLRQGLRFASGKALTSSELVHTIRRSQSLSRALSQLKIPKRLSETAVLFPGTAIKDHRHLAVVLAQLRAAIVPLDFSPSRPVGCGAFRAHSQLGGLELRRNDLAPRGGAFLDKVVLRTSTIEDSLRFFESTRGDLTLLGTGLHQPRKGAREFHLKSLGLVVLVPSKNWQPELKPGQLHAQLAHLPNGPFSALGLDRTRLAPAKWGGPPFSILVDRAEPWLVSIAEELRSAFARGNGEISVVQASKSTIEKRVRENAFDTRLGFISNVEVDPDMASMDLFGMDGGRAPRGGRSLSPMEAAQQLRLGIVGSLQPSGAQAPALQDAVSGGRITLESTQLLT